MTTPPKTRPDKQKVIDEVWDDERVKSFLHTQTPISLGEEVPGDRDFYVLLRAYQAMRVHDFERFLEFFLNAKGNLSAKNEKGQTLADYISTHRKAAPFIDAMVARSS